MSDLKFREINSAWFDATTEARDLQFGAKFDGCVSITRVFNGGTVDSQVNANDVNCLHVCDAAEMVDQLFQVIQHAARLDAFAEFSVPPETLIRRLVARLPLESRGTLLASLCHGDAVVSGDK